MELHHRVELIDTLMEEADQKTQSLHMPCMRKNVRSRPGVLTWRAPHR